MVRKRFWMVYNPQGGAPTYQHSVRASADKEAARLASMHPGQEFYVLKAVGGATAIEPVLTGITLEKPDADDHIPF